MPLYLLLVDTEGMGEQWLPRSNRLPLIFNYLKFDHRLPAVFAVAGGIDDAIH